MSDRQRPFRRGARLAPLALIAAALGACEDATDPGSSPAPEASALPTLVDVNPDPAVVEVRLTAAPGQTEYLPGKPASIWGYRDGSVGGSAPTVPGPMLEARPGQRVIVRYRNDLPVSTTVHWHGLRLPNAADGTPSSQMPVPPGGEFVYDFVAKDAGTFWYHPHLEADVLIERGLYGVMRVREDAGPTVTADRVFVLDDVKITADGVLSDVTDPLDVMLGRQGNVVIVNGRQSPRQSVTAGTRERWRFVNTANGRYFRLKMGDRPLFVVAWDGGLLPRPYATDTLVIAPGERYEILTTFSRADEGRTLTLQTIHYDRGHDIPDPGPIDLLRVEIGAATQIPPEPELPLAWGQWQAIPVNAATPVRKFELREEEGVAFPKFFINDESFPNHTPIHAEENAVEIWEIHNETEMDHPFHLHGTFFQVLDVNGVPPAHLGIKDTVNVPRDAKLRFAVRHEAPGNWMYHCHILEHAERGMMGEVKVAAPGAPSPIPPKHP